jgi:hypothetical protein
MACGAAFGVRLLCFGLLLSCTFCFTVVTVAQAQSADKKSLWKAVPFAIVKFNEEAPQSWNLYHTEKRGLLLCRLWKRYMLIDLNEEEVFDIDPQKIKQQGDDIEWSLSETPDQPIEISEWKTRGVGSLERVRFRFGKNGHFLELQIPLRPDGKSLY